LKQKSFHDNFFPFCLPYIYTHTNIHIFCSWLCQIKKSILTSEMANAKNSVGQAAGNAKSSTTKTLSNPIVSPNLKVTWGVYCTSFGSFFAKGKANSFKLNNTYIFSAWIMHSVEHAWWTFGIACSKTCLFYKSCHISMVALLGVPVVDKTL
jgi:hypothetical protein